MSRLSWNLTLAIQEVRVAVCLSRSLSRQVWRRAGTWVGAVAIVLGFASISSAQVRPRLIPFQGRVLTADGAPLGPQTVAMTFAIYTQPEGQAEPLWSEPHPAVAVTNSQVNVLLGQITSLDDPAGNGSKPKVTFDQGTLYLGITIGTGSSAQEMVPRHQLVPAFHARTTDLASAVIANGVDANAIRANAITADKLGTGAVTAPKISPGAVGSSQLANGAVVGAKISPGSITADKIAPGVIPTPGASPVPGATPVARFVAEATIPAGVSIPLQASFTQLVSAGLTIEATSISDAGAGVQIPCSAGPSTGTDCGANPEAVGIVVNLPRPGSYEVCAAGSAGLQVYGPAPAAGIQLKIVFTENNSPAPLPGGEPTFFWSKNMGLVSIVTGAQVFQDGSPLNHCEMFRVAAGQLSKATFRVFGKASGNQNNSPELAQNLRLRVTEVQ